MEAQGEAGLLTRRAIQIQSKGYRGSEVGNGALEAKVDVIYARESWTKGIQTVRLGVE